ncbi:MAG TPA: FAD-binding oxidoreductase [Candidatus Xenobia bacterium]|jgi:glycolate oxidase FAD binding subunit
MSWEVDGRVPSQVWEPRDSDELLEMLGRAQREGLSVIPWGGGTGMALGGVPSRYDVALSTAGLKRLVMLSPDDLVVTVEAGMTLAELDAHVAPHGLRLPLDPPAPDQATVGGVLATNGYGPLRHSQGTPRDLVLGIKVGMSDGRPLKGGGQVVKNVSGYDLVRLMVGSSGTLGVIFEATFKLLPRPAASRWLELSCASPAFCEEWLERLSGPDFRLSSLELYRDGGLTLYIGLEGEPEMVEAQAALVPDARRCEGIPQVDGPLVIKASVLPSDVVPLLERVDGVAVLGAAGLGVLRFFCPPQKAWVDRIRQAVHAVGGTVVVERAPVDIKRGVRIWDDPGDSLPWMRQVKDTLDPTGTFSPGRFVDGL